MRFLIVGMLAIAAVMPTVFNSSDSISATPPIEAVIVQPADLDVDSWYGPNAQSRATLWFCGMAMPVVEQYYEEQTGYGYKYNCRYHVSSKTALELQSESGIPIGMDGCTVGAIEGGQGISQNRLVFDVGRDELGLPVRDGRHIFLYINGGGYAAGGSGSVPNMTEPPLPINDWGEMYMGDWGLYHALTGNPDPCCVVRNGGGAWCGLPQEIDPLTGLAVTAGDAEAFFTVSHESCHMFGLWGCHRTPQVQIGVPLLLEDVRQFPIFNHRFVFFIGMLTPTPTYTPTVTTASSPPTPTPTVHCPPGHRRQGRC